MILAVQYIGNKYGPVPRTYWMPDPPVEWTWKHNPAIPSWYVWIVPLIGYSSEHEVWYTPAIEKSFE